MKPVLTKRDFVRRYQAGEFGNRSPTWEVDELLKQWDLSVEAWSKDQEEPKVLSGKDAKYHLRNKIAGGETFYNLSFDSLMKQLVHLKGGFDGWYVSEMAPTKRTLIQGEIKDTEYGLYLSYTKVAKPMREALAEQQDHAFGLEAKIILAQYMDFNSYDWVRYLLEAYPDHVIEFSTYGVEWGTVPHMNTVFWEIRKY